MRTASIDANGVSSVHSIVFIDTSVSGAEALAASLPQDAEIVMIDPAQDGIAEITAALAGRTGISAIHVISHGESGTLEIGGSILTDATVGRFAPQIQSWSASLAPGANILLYGCDVAGNPAGQSLVQSIASLTGAAVAASTHLVGDAALGGVSTLDYDVGTVTTAAIDTSGLDDVLTHFRASNLTWNVTSGRTIQFNMQTSFRASYFGSPAVGDIVNIGTSLNFGDNKSAPIYLKVISLNTLSDYFVGQMVTASGAPITHTYAANVNYTAYWESGNRLSSLQNFADAGWEGQTIIDVGRGTQSPVSSLAPIIQVADNSIASFQIPAIDVDGDTLVYKLGTANQFISSSSSSATVVAPAGLVVDSNTGVVTWDIRNSVRPTVSTGQLWVATVMVEAHDKVTGALKSETPLDFLLQIVDTSSTKPPVFTVVPPATTINVGQTQEVVLVATDPAGALTSITALNPPIGLTTIYHADEGELHVDFTPTAAEAGSSFVVNFQALDAQGLTTNTSVTFSVPLAYPIVTLDAQPAASNITKATLGTAVPGASGDPLTVTLTSDAAFASGSTLTLSNGSLIYTPGLVTAAQAGADVIQYTVTDTVSGAVTRETQTVTLSNGPAPSVVLAASPAADNMTHATLGTATAGFGSDALSVRLTADADFATGSSIALVGSNIVYTPGLVTTGIVGPDTISYTVTDTVTGAVTTKTQAVTLNNGPAPVVTLATAPVASGIAPATLGTASPGFGSDALTVTLTSDADFATGSTLVLAGGQLVYTPGVITQANAGADTLHYTVTDTVTGAVTTETQTITLKTLPPPVVTLQPAPSADNTHTALLGTATPGTEGDALSVTLKSDADFTTGSTLTLTGGQLVYTPGIITAAKIGADTISYDVTDLRTGAVTHETQTVLLSNGPAPVVTLAATPKADGRDPAILGTAVAGENNHPLSVTLNSDSVFSFGSSISLVGGVLTYTPGMVTIGNIGSDTLGYTVTDTVTGASVYETQTLSLTLLDVKSNNAIYLTGQGNSVTGPLHRALSSGNQGAEITDPTPWIAGGTITGTPDTETIRVRGYQNTIIADGGNDTIYAGTSDEHVIVSDFNGDNIVKGFVDTTSVVLGDGNNIIDIGGHSNDVRLGNGNNTIFAGVAAIKVKVGDGDNVISTTGYGDIITAGSGHNTIDAGFGYASVTLAGGTSTVTAGGYFDVFNIAGGTTSLGGFAGYATINMGLGFGAADSIDLRNTASDSFTFKNGQMLVTQQDGELVATINTPNGRVVSAIDDGAGGHRIVLGLITPPAPAVITETTWGVTLDLADATKTVHLVGYGNTVTGGNGDHLIDGDAGGLKLNLADGRNTVSVSGTGDTIILGNGDNVVSGTLGSSAIHTGAGNQTITAAGYYNDIKTGAGNSTIKAGAGFSKVDAGSGINTISVDGSQNTVITHDGDSTVALSGWSNLIQAGAGHTLVGGGFFNTYEVTALGDAGGVEVADFSTQYGDVLNLHDVLGVNSIVSVADGIHGDLLVSVTNGSTSYVAADLHGMAGASLAGLLANHSITV